MIINDMTVDTSTPTAGPTRVAIATPLRGADTMSAQVTFGYASFLAQLSSIMKIELQVGFCLDVVRARNRIAAHILTNPDFADIEDVLWVDDDTYPERPQIVAEMIQHSHIADIVAAPYTNKTKPVRWVHRAEAPDRVLGVGFGFTMTTRRALLKVWDASEPYFDGLECRNMFGQVYDEIQGRKVLLSEDFSFCKRARDAGVKIELHTTGGLIMHSGAVAFSAEDM